MTSLLPGDVVLFGGTIGNYHHSGIYAGSGKVWDALDNNIPVQEHPFSKVYSDYGNVFDGAYRYTAQSATPLSMTTTSLPGGTVYSTSHRSYSATLHATGGHPPYVWSLAAGLQAPATRPGAAEHRGDLGEGHQGRGLHVQGRGGGHQDGGLRQGDGGQVPRDQDLVAGLAGIGSGKRRSKISSSPIKATV